jgi:hypothetical protein
MKTRIIFHSVTQDGLEFGSNETRSVSRVHFDLERGHETHGGLHVDIEEPVNTRHEENEVSVGAFESPIKLERKAFERVVRHYYQSLVTSAGYGKHLAKGKGFRSHGDVLGREQVFEL